jgi:hypothetical protein
VNNGQINIRKPYARPLLSKREQLPQIVAGGSTK